jgi:uncharacterized peroxidase-related enzyme
VWALGARCRVLQRTEAVKAIEEWSGTLTVAPPERAIAAFAGALTLDPNAMTAARVHALRAVGLGDRAVYDVVMVVACFAFMNRVADGTGVTVQADRYDLARELLGEVALADHLRWSRGDDTKGGL